MNHEELISAYLDDELPAEQREEIERLLAADAAARRLFDELRAQRDALAALPRLGIGRDLTAEVLRAAERRMLLDAATPAGFPRETSAWLRRARRPAAWAALVLAAGLLIMLLAPREEPEGLAAVAPGTESARERADVDRDVAPLAVEEADRKSGESFPGRDAAELGVPAAPLDVNAVPALGKGGSRSTALGQNRFGKADAPVNAPTAPAPRSSQAALRGGAPPAASLEQSAESAPQSLGFDPPAAPLASGTLLICDASPEAVADNAFTRVLANNDVQVETPGVDASSPRADWAVAGGFDTQSTGEAESNVRATTWVVQATEEQMLGILDELSQQPTRFNVAVAPAPSGASQQQPLPASEYLSQFPHRGSYRARRLSQGLEARQEGGEPSLGNAWIVNRLSQSPGGPVNIEVPDSDVSKKEPAQGRVLQGGGAGGQARSRGNLPPAPGEPLQSYMIILREAPASNAPRQQAAPAAPEP